MPRNTVKTAMINATQRKIIYASAKKLGLVDRSQEIDPLHEIIYAVAGVEHINEMTETQADIVISRIKGFLTPKPEKKKIEVREGMASEGQIKKMWALIFKLQEVDPREGVSTKARLNGFIKKYAHVDDIRFLDKESANSIIEGLKSIIGGLEERHEKK